MGALAYRSSSMRFRTLALVAFVCALASVDFASSASAQSGGRPSRETGAVCVNPSGRMRAVGEDEPCRSNEQRINDESGGGEEGPAGPAGPPGPPGPAGPAG